jgi:hypothetical protein
MSNTRRRASNDSATDRGLKAASFGFRSIWARRGQAASGKWALSGRARPHWQEVFIALIHCCRSIAPSVSTRLLAMGGI